MTARFPVAVLVSGSGTNLQAILDHAHGRDGVEVVVVASSKADAYALERARQAGLEAAVFESHRHGGRQARDRELAAWLKAHGVRLVALAGFMELLTPAFLAQFPNAVINVHPALLPAFPGARPIDDQLDYGVKVSGVTVHFVDEGVDSGPILLQEATELPYTRSREETLEALHEIEHRLLPRAIRLIALNAVEFDRENPRLVRVDDSLLKQDATP